MNNTRKLKTGLKITEVPRTNFWGKRKATRIEVFTNSDYYNELREEERSNHIMFVFSCIMGALIGLLVLALVLAQTQCESASKPIKNDKYKIHRA